KIELLYLPSYSPNLNLIERLWKFVMKEVLTCRYYEDFTRFKAAVVECLEGIEGKHKDAITSLLTLNFQTFEGPQLLAARSINLPLRRDQLDGFPDSLQIDPSPDALLIRDTRTRSVHPVEMADHRPPARRRQEELGVLLRPAGQLAGAQVGGQD